MRIPLEVTFRHMEPSTAVEASIREKAEKLELFYDSVMGCRVVVEAPHEHHRQGNLYQVSIDLTVPSGELAVTRGHHHQSHAHEDIYVAIRDAFNVARRRLEEYGRRQRGDIKTHEPPDQGRVAELYPDNDYGMIETIDGQLIYFHRNSVLDGSFDRLELGNEVRFVIEAGDEEPRASTVRPLARLA